MNSLGVPHQLGAPVSLQWTDPQGEQHTDQFTLCGWWYSPTNFSEACAWVSAETATQLMPGYDSENAANITLGVTLHQPRELEQQAQQILQPPTSPTTAPVWIRRSSRPSPSIPRPSWCWSAAT